MMSDHTQFIPFHAINEFMRPDFKLSIIRDVVNNTSLLPQEQASALANITKRAVKIPGFRNSEKAPAMLKVMPMVKAFEKSPELVFSVLSAWATIHPELRDQVYSLLRHRNWPVFDSADDFSLETIAADIIEKWPVFPPEVNRKHIPGFWPRWPKGEDFEALFATYNELFTTSDNSMDKVSLMAVWLTLRLPYEIDDAALVSE
jgi:hypothetical protein